MPKFIFGLYTNSVDLLIGYRLNHCNGCAIYRRYQMPRWASCHCGFGFQAHLITTLRGRECPSHIEIPLAGLHLTKERGSPSNLRNFLSTGHTLCEILIRRLRRAIYQN